MKEVADKVAFITGGAGGMGFGMPKASVRPERYKNTGDAPRAGAGGPPPGALPPGPNPMDLAMDPQEVGEKVLRGILRNDLYILTHSEFGDQIREHFDAILASFPSQPPGTPPAGGANLMRSRIYREGRTGNPMETGK